METGGELGSAHWGRNLREPVEFAAAVKMMVADGCDAFIELGAHPVLLAPVQQSLDASGSNAIITGSGRRESDEQTELLASLAALHASGYPVDFGRLYPEGNLVQFPTYSWERESHWIDQGPGRYGLQPGATLMSGRFAAPFVPGTTLWAVQIGDTGLSYC